MVEAIFGGLGAAGGKAAGGAIVKVVISNAPTGVAWAKTWLKGQKVIIVGPGGSGKSTFLRYLRYNLFQHEQEYHTTYEPVERKRFELKVGGTQCLSVAIKRATDLPGQQDVSEVVYAQRPHALVIVLDVGSAEAQAKSADWLLGFFQQLDERWEAKNKRNRLLSVIVVMNKIDKLVGSTKIDVETRLREITNSCFKIARPPAIRHVQFKPCIMVENPGGFKLVDAVIIDMALSLRKAQ